MEELGRILIIDDNEDDREFFRRMLSKQRSWKFELYFAATGDEGLALARQAHPDCILLDYSMPGRNGVAVLHDLLAIDRHFPIIMLTGQGNEAVAVEVMKSGALDYLIKGDINTNALVRAIAGATAQKRLAAKLEQHQEALEIFTKAMAHDLKEPLRTIRSFSRIVYDQDDLSGQARECMDYVLKAADHMERLINSVSRYSRLDAYSDVEMQPVELADVVQAAAESIRDVIDSRNAEILFDDLGIVLGDEALLTQLVQNLISNAMRYTTDKVPVVRITTERHGDSLRLIVSDNGPGIAENHREMIFKPFKRLVGRSVEGSGLGLAICRKIAEMHGARISCVDGPDGGAAFVTEFPASRSRGQILERADAIEARAQEIFMRPAEVLLVEDSPADVKLLRIKLMEMDKVHFNLHVVNNGVEAVQWLKACLERNGRPLPDLVLLDINMPIMDGFQTLETIKADPQLKDLSVIMLSTSSEESDIKRARKIGADAYMVKPATGLQLREAIKHTPRIGLVESGEGLRLMV